MKTKKKVNNYPNTEYIFSEPFKDLEHARKNLPVNADFHVQDALEQQVLSCARDYLLLRL